MKPLQVLEKELLDIQRGVENMRGLIVPSAQDAAVAALKDQTGRAMAFGGLETVIRLVQAARARGEL